MNTERAVCPCLFAVSVKITRITETMCLKSIFPNNPNNMTDVTRTANIIWTYLYIYNNIFNDQSFQYFNSVFIISSKSQIVSDIEICISLRNIVDKNNN